MVHPEQHERRLGGNYSHARGKNQILAAGSTGQHEGKMRLSGLLAIGASMKLSRRTHHKTNKGFSLIELLFSLFILTFGILAAMTMVIVGVSRNGSNRFDTTATNVAQTVLEEISGTAPTANPTLTVTDCTGANLQINTAAGGAKLLANGYIDFTQAAATLSANNYQMNYTVCGSNG